MGDIHHLKPKEAIKIAWNGENLVVAKPTGEGSIELSVEDQDKLIEEITQHRQPWTPAS